MDLIPITDEDNEENSFKLALEATIRYGTNHAFLDRFAKPRPQRGYEAFLFVNRLITLIDFGIDLGFIDLNENRELRDLVFELEFFAKRNVGEIANVPSVYVAGNLIPLPLDDFLHESFRFDEEIFVKFPLLRKALEKISILPIVKEIAPIVHQLINSRLDDLDEENQVMFESSLKPIVLIGRSGVGKTQIAQNLVSVLFALDVIKSEEFTTYHPDNEIRAGIGSTEARLKQLLVERQSLGGVFFVDNLHRAFEGLVRDATFAYKANAINLLVNQLRELQSDGVFVILAGTKNQTLELLSTMESSDSKINIFEIKAPSIESLVSFVAAHMNHRGIDTHSAFEVDLSNAFKKLNVNNEKFGNWKTANAVVAELRKLSKGNRLFGNPQKPQIVDGPILAQMFKNLFNFDDDYLVEVARHRISDAENSASATFELGLKTLRGGDAITG